MCTFLGCSGALSFLASTEMTYDVLINSSHSGIQVTLFGSYTAIAQNATRFLAACVSYFWYFRPGLPFFSSNEKKKLKIDSYDSCLMCKITPSSVRMYSWRILLAMHKSGHFEANPVLKPSSFMTQSKQDKRNKMAVVEKFQNEKF